MKEIKGIHVLAMFCLGFGVIIAVNATLAINAVRTFPGLETANSYVVSQQFDTARAAQEALAWDVSARVTDDELELLILSGGEPVRAEITEAVFGRATSVAADQHPVFTYAGGRYTAPVHGGAGNWNLRLVALAPDGTEFRQRVIVEAAP